jgi:hypothetical protein
MATNRVCPFTRKSCIECALYRGRHCYLGRRHPARNPAVESENERKGPAPGPTIDLRRLGDPLRRGTTAGVGSAGRPRFRLRITDMETDETRVCEFGEARTWDWNRSQMLRLIDGCQITSLDQLLEIACRKADKGCEEVDVCEAPRLMLFSGG